MIVGSMYTSHVPIIAPKISVAAYFNKRHTERNQKTSYSITVQGVVDHRGVFTDVCIGWPGSMPDDQVLEKSALFQRANGGLLKGFWYLLIDSMADDLRSTDTTMKWHVEVFVVSPT